MSFIAGPYTGTYFGDTIGQLEDGFDLSFSHFYEHITGDNFSRTVQTLITQGEDAYIAATLLESNAIGIHRMVWPIHDTFGVIGQVGRDVVAFGLAKSLRFQVIAGTTAGPALIELGLAIMPQGHQVRLQHAPKLKRVPILMMGLPDALGVLINAV